MAWIMYNFLVEDTEDEGYEPYIIRLRDNDTNQVEDITYRYPLGYDPEDIEFYWTDGNGACDCNRALEFYRKRGIPDVQRRCGTTRMILLGIWRVSDGVQIVAEEEP